MPLCGGPSTVLPEPSPGTHGNGQPEGQSYGEEKPTNIRPDVGGFSRGSYIDRDAVYASNLLDCAAGSCPLGTSEQVVRAARAFSWDDLARYPEPGYRELKEEICAFWSREARLDVDMVKVGNGSGIVLFRLAMLFLEPGVATLGYMPQFPDWVAMVGVVGGEYDGVALDPAEGFRFDCQAFLARLALRPYPLVYIDNPNNPTGQLIPLDEVEQIARECERRDSVLIVDEAFGDYVDETCSGVNLVERYPNVVVTRTFSKGMGLAGVRVGYGLMSHYLGEFYDRIDVPLYPVSGLAVALATASLHDRRFLQNNRVKMAEAKRHLLDRLVAKGYTVARTNDSCSIFTLGDRDREVDLHAELLRQGILTTAGRNFDNLGHNYVRVNTPQHPGDFLARLEGQE
ncbi:MAG: histidinol-phosphate aminotransferase family protein [Actinomycetia bacterium]|nr:histidinol-phosphate aminotransferase family protein [Actinomycetes bacterium]